VWKYLAAEQRFRELDAPEKMMQVFLGLASRDRLEAKREEVLAVA